MSLQRILLGSVALTLCATGSAFAETTTKADAHTDYVTRDEFPELLREALVSKPDIMIEVMGALRKAQLEKAEKEISEGLEKNSAALFEETDYPSIGSKDADITVVEFFDYHCGYCKRALPTINGLVKADKNVRVVFRDLPILSEDSSLAARAALAVHIVSPSKYFDFHTKLMKMNGKFTETILTDAAKSVGVDSTKFKEALDSKAITKMLDATQEVAKDIGVRGTPAFALPGEVIPGAVSLDELVDIIAKIRKERSAKE